MREAIINDQRSIPAGRAIQAEMMTLPEQPRGVVVWCAGSTPEPAGPRGHRIAVALHAAGLGTIGPVRANGPRPQGHSVLTPDVGLLARQLVAGAVWATRDRRTAGLPLAYYGEGKGAACALIAAAVRPELVQVVVAHGGGLALSATPLERVRAPTLLMVDGGDPFGLDASREAFGRLRGPKELFILPAAPELSGARAGDAPASRAVVWLLRHLRSERRGGGASRGEQETRSTK